ncbi:MAG: hypothetical protein LIO90_04490 [Bacteroidales bacterium]|nr:hypothetical protein [Bacteroidales bacterium]
MKESLPQKQFGLPGYDEYSEAVHQGLPDDCAIKTQELLLRGLGIDVNESQLVADAIEHGWYTPSQGTLEANVGKLMELYGIDVTQTHGANIYHLMLELAKGHPVLVGVDSGELWNSGFEETVEDMFWGPRSDHALLVAGIEFDDDFSSGIVNLIDPGTGDLCKPYDMDQFLDAWNDSDNFMLTFS